MLPGVESERLTVMSGDVGRSQEVQQQIKTSSLKMAEANNKIRDLGINIRCKH